MKIGWSEKSITPDRRVWEDGQFYERVSTGVETPITCTAWAVEGNGEQFVICSCDLVGIGENLVDRVREALRAGDHDGLDVNSVLINATHSHTNYGYTRYNHTKVGGSLDVLKRYVPADRKWVNLLPADTEGVMTRDEGLEYLVPRIADCIAEAWENRAEGAYLPGFGRPAVGMNRRVCFADGTAKMWGDTYRPDFTQLEGGNDSGMELIFTYDAAGRLTGVVSNIACPSQVMEQRSVISSDYWGKVKILLRKRYGDDIKVLALCSAAGDQCPRDLIRWVEPETPILDPNVHRDDPPERGADPSMFDVKGTWVVARRIVSEIGFAMEDNAGLTPIRDAVVKHTAVSLPLPLRRVTEAEKVEAEAAIKAFVDSRDPSVEFNYDDSAAMHVHAGVIARWEVQKGLDRVPVELHFMRLGSLAFASNPFELFLDYGNRIRAHSPARQTFLVQLCNGTYGYLPTEKAEQGGHYSAYVSSGYFGHDGGAELVDASLNNIEKLFED